MTTTYKTFGETTIETEHVDYGVRFYFEVDPGEPRTHDHPGIAPSFEVYRFEVRDVSWIDGGEYRSHKPTLITAARVEAGLMDTYNNNEDFQQEMDELCRQSA